MKYLKTFENNNMKPQVGDYVLCKEADDVFPEVKEFTSNNIGKLIEIENLEKYPYMIKYKNIPKNLADYFQSNTRGMDISEIIFYSKDKDEVEARINATKYNL